MTRRVDDNETARAHIHIAPGDVDGDALLALRHEAVDQQAEVRNAIRAGRTGNERALIVRNMPRIPQQPADERRFAVIDGPAGQDVNDAVELDRHGRRSSRARNIARFVRRLMGADHCRSAMHQK